MVLINELTVEQINAALLHLQRSKDEVVGGNKGTTIQNITISNSGGGGGNNVDYSGAIKNLANLITKNTTAIDKNTSDIAKLKSDFSNIEKSVEDTLQGLVDNGISDLSFDPLTKQLTITTNDGDTFQTTITQDIGVLSYDSATNKLILTTGEQTQEITLPYIKASEKGSANGIATLDENGRVPYSQLPESAMEFLGQWDASTNTPHLTDGTGTNGDFYIVSAGGTVNLGTEQDPHIVTFSINDRIVYEGDIAQWVRLPAGQVSSVNGQSGEVTLTANDIEYSTGVSIKAKIDANAVQADWNVSDTTSLAYIKNKPTIPASPVQSDWNVTDTTSLAYIKNKPSVAVLGNTAGCGLGTASAGSCTTAARSDHVHPLPSVLGGIAINSGACSSYNEGIRINAANNGFAVLNIGAAAGTTSGVGGFWIGVNNTSYAGKLYINYETFSKNSYFCCCSDGTVFWNGNVCGTASCADNAFISSWSPQMILDNNISYDVPFVAFSPAASSDRNILGLSTGRKIRYNPSTCTLCVPNICATCFRGNMNVGSADAVYYSALLDTSDKSYPLVFSASNVACGYVSLRGNTNSYFCCCYTCPTKSHFRFHAQIAPVWRLLATPTFTCNQGSDTGTNWYLCCACIDDAHQRGQVEVWNCTSLSASNDKVFSITLPNQLCPIKSAIFTYMCDCVGNRGGPELSAFVVGTCKICFGVYNRNSSTKLCKPHFLLQWWY